MSYNKIKQYNIIQNKKCIFLATGEIIRDVKAFALHLVNSDLILGTSEYGPIFHPAKKQNISFLGGGNHTQWNSGDHLMMGVKF